MNNQNNNSENSKDYQNQFGVSGDNRPESGNQTASNDQVKNETTTDEQNVREDVSVFSVPVTQNAEAGFKIDENIYSNEVALEEKTNTVLEDNDPQSASSTVVVSNQSNNTPRWFYFIFILTLIIFIIVTSLLVLTFINKDFKLPFISKPSPTPIPVVYKKPIIPTPIITKEPEDPVLIKLKLINDSDELQNIEKDLKETDLSFIDENINLLDKVFSSAVN
jgi:hypothetical protein